MSTANTTAADTERARWRERRENGIALAIVQLKSNERGKAAIAMLVGFLDETVSCDDNNKHAIALLITECWSGHAGTVLDRLKEATR